MTPRVHRSRVTHDRWLVSYADFITLLFAFFVVMYAFVAADKQKPAQVSAAIDSAFQSMAISRDTPQTLAPAVNPENANVLSGVVTIAQNPQSVAVVEDDLERIQRELEGTLASQIAGHTISIHLGGDGLVISLREAGFFDSGSAAPRPDSLGTLRQIAATLGRTPYDVRIEGHTDNIPVHNAEFDSNWELSSSRATRIARLFIEMHTFAPDRLSAAGFAEFRPIASNDSPEGRAQNRRVDLVVLPRSIMNFAAKTQVGSGAGGPWRKITDE